MSDELTEADRLRIRCEAYELRIAELKGRLFGMVESFDVLMEIAQNIPALKGMVEGAFIGTVEPARSALAKQGKDTP